MMFLYNNCLNFQFFVFVLTIFVHVSGWKNIDGKQKGIDTFISGGTIEDKYDLAKYTVSIQWKIKQSDDEHFGWYHFCGGAIIGKTKILTAAHCLFKLLKPKTIVVVVGLRNRFIRTSTTSVKEVAYIRTNKDYKKKRRFFADIAYLILKEEIALDNTTVAIIGLPKSAPKEEQPSTAIGWGKFFYKGPSSDNMRFVDVKVFSFSICKKLHPKNFYTGMLCAGDLYDWSKDACTADSGGPLISHQELVGIVSWGKGCGTTNKPGVYSDVYYFKSWIESNGQELHASPMIILTLLHQMMT